jgi:hypothetical protein
VLEVARRSAGLSSSNGRFLTNRPFAHSAKISGHKGRWPSSRTLAAGCNGRGWRRKTSGANADGQGVWSWRPDAGVKLAGDDLQATVAKEPDHRPITGEHVIGVKTIAQGRPGNSGEPVVTMLVWFLIPTRGCGCIGHPAFPAPSDFMGEWFLAQLGRYARRGDADACLRFGVGRISESVIRYSAKDGGLRYR